jgi:hypothetical protein
MVLGFTVSCFRQAGDVERGARRLAAQAMSLWVVISRSFDRVRDEATSEARAAHRATAPS